MLHKKWNRMDYVVEICMLAVGICICIAILYPIWNLFAQSLSDDTNVLRGNVKWIPRGFDASAYVKVFTNKALWRAFGNSIYIALMGCLCSLVATMFAAYPLACCRFPGKKIYNIFVLIPMWFTGGMIPTYLCIQKLGLINSFWSLILGGLISSYNVLVLSSFLKGLPDSILESARIDGAGELRIMFRIVFPLSKASLATIALWVIAGHWNAYMGPMMYLTQKEKYTLQQVLRDIVLEANATQYDFGSAGSDYAVSLGPQIQYAVLIVSMIPMLILYPFIQKYFVSGVTLGAVKG